MSAGLNMEVDHIPILTFDTNIHGRIKIVWLALGVNRHFSSVLLGRRMPTQGCVLLHRVSLALYNRRREIECTTTERGRGAWCYTSRRLRGKNI